MAQAHKLCQQPGLGARDDALAMQYQIQDWFDPKQPALDR